jgi:hypothetical protein
METFFTRLMISSGIRSRVLSAIRTNSSSLILIMNDDTEKRSRSRSFQEKVLMRLSWSIVDGLFVDYEKK